MKVYQTKGSALEQRERTYIADGMMSVFVTEMKSGTHKMVNIEGLLSGTLDEKSVAYGIAALADKFVEATEMNAIEKLRFSIRAIKELLFHRGENA